jgi:hypothetical protein
MLLGLELSRMQMMPIRQLNVRIKEYVTGRLANVSVLRIMKESPVKERFAQTDAVMLGFVILKVNWPVKLAEHIALLGTLKKK